MIYTIFHSNELYHHGVKGMKWGVRKDRSSKGRNTSSAKESIDQYTQKKSGNYTYYEKTAKNSDGEDISIFFFHNKGDSDTDLKTKLANIDAYKANAAKIEAHCKKEMARDYIEYAREWSGNSKLSEATLAKKLKLRAVYSPGFEDSVELSFSTDDRKYLLDHMLDVEYDPKRKLIVGNTMDG